MVWEYFSSMMGQSEPGLLSYCLTKKLRNTSFLKFLLLLFIQSGDTYKFSLSHFQLFFKEYVWWRCKLLIMYIIWNKRKNNAQLTSTAWKVSVFGVFLVCTFPYLDSIRGDTPCFSVFCPNVGKYGPKKLRIPELFTQCTSLHKK